MTTNRATVDESAASSPRARAVPRGSPWYRTLTSAFLLLLPLGCQNLDLQMVHEPRFTSYAPTYPEARDGYPGGPWGEPSDPFDVAGYDYMLRFLPESPDADDNVVQRVLANGVLGRTVTDCASDPTPIALVVYEYFRSPANDVQAFFISPAEATLSLEVRSTTGYIELPGTPPAIDPGENAAFLTPAYVAALSDDQREDIAEAIDEGSYLRWRHDYAYDGCRPTAPATPCGELHCLDFAYNKISEGTQQPTGSSAYTGGR